MNGDNIKVDYELTAQDYIDFNLFHMNNSKKMKNILFIQRFIIPLIYFALPFVLARSTNVPFWLWMVAALVVYAVWVKIYPKRMKKSISQKLLRALKEERNAKLMGKHSCTLSKDMIVDIGKGGETKAKWSSILDVIESETHVFIFISDSKAFIIPKRALTTEELRQQFIAKVNEMKALHLVKIHRREEVIHKVGGFYD